VSKIETVWLLGANGFTGKYLVPILQAQSYIVVIERVDISCRAAVQEAMLRIQPDYIINLAGISFVPDDGSSHVYAINTLGPQNILEACLKLEQAPKRIILASSANIYGLQSLEQINEDCSPDPVNHYGCSKLAMEQIAKTYSNKLNIIITRPFNYTGKGQAGKFLIPKIIEHFKKREHTIKLGNIDIWRDFSDVRWVAQAYKELLTISNDKLEIVNLCSGNLTSIREIIDTLQHITGHTINIETAPEFIRQTDIKSQCGDNSFLFELAPKLCQPINIKDTLSWMME